MQRRRGAVQSTWFGQSLNSTAGIGQKPVDRGNQWRGKLSAKSHKLLILRVPEWKSVMPQSHKRAATQSCDSLRVPL